MFNEYVYDAGQLFEATPTNPLGGMPAFANCIFQSNPGLPDRQSMCLGAGLYFITYHDVPIYIGKFLGRFDDVFKGDLFSARWLRHISTISLRGSRISISPRLQNEFTIHNPQHGISASISAADPVMLGKDRGFQVAGNRLMFAASNWSVFQLDPGQWLANLKFGYVQLEEAFWRDRGFGDQRIWTAIDAAERSAIDAWRPQVNGGVRNAATTAVNPTALLASLKELLQGELENCPAVAPADSPPADVAEPLQAVVSEFRHELKADDEEAKDTVREDLPDGCPTAVLEAIIGALQGDQHAEVHYTLTNGGDLRVRVLDVSRPRNVFTIYWQRKNQQFFGRALVPFGDVARLAGITTAKACPRHEPLWCEFTVDCSGKASAAAVADVVRLAVQNLRNEVGDPR